MKIDHGPWTIDDGRKEIRLKIKKRFPLKGVETFLTIDHRRLTMDKRLKIKERSKDKS